MPAKDERERVIPHRLVSRGHIGPPFLARIRWTPYPKDKLCVCSGILEDFWSWISRFLASPESCAGLQFVSRGTREDCFKPGLMGSEIARVGGTAYCPISQGIQLPRTCIAFDGLACSVQLPLKGSTH